MCLIRGMGVPPELVHASMRLFGFCSKGPSEAERYYVELTEVVKQEERSGSGPPQDGLRELGGGVSMMAVAGTATSALSEFEHRVQLRRAVIASTIGTTIEWYDFFLYSTVTGLVFAKLYFPESDPLVGTLQAFGIYAVGFVARPIGAAIFGHYGDRIGRKAALIATLLLMGIATFLVAFVPTYAEIGIWGAVILTVLRFIQCVEVAG